MTTKPVGGAGRLPMNEKVVSREEFNNGIADEAAQSCVDWSNPERRKEALRYIVKQIWDEARGPVGGAGELPFLLGRLRGITEALRTTNIFRGREIMQLADDIERAAKAPQGVAAAEILYDHCREIIENKNHPSNGVREAYQALLAMANPGYPAPESTGGPQKMAALPHTREKIAIALCRLRSPEALRNWDTEHPWIKDYHYKQADAVLAVLAAPPAPSLPVPGPVSDDTIHHGMFPPAPTNNSFDLGAAVKNLHALQRVGEAMGLHVPPTDVESLAATFHGIYQQEAKRQGDVRHKDAYAELPDNVKEFDRVLARYVLAGECGPNGYRCQSNQREKP